MSEIKPTVPEAIDHLESFIKGLPYFATQDTKCAIRVVLEELARVQAELQKAAGEIVVLRESLAVKPPPLASIRYRWMRYEDHYNECSKCGPGGLCQTGKELYDKAQPSKTK